MLLVNLQGSEAASFPLLVHAAWHGLTLADMVFPAFLLAVGLSVPLALDRGRPAATTLLVRTGKLLLIGIALGWLLRPSLDLAEWRLTGVLQRIAIVYLAAALVARSSRGWQAAAVLALLGLVAHTVVLLAVAAPGEAAASLAPGQGISGWLDRTLLPGRLHRGTYDPEGLLSTVPAIATGLIGVAVMRALQQARWPMLPLLATAAGLAGAGWLSTYLVPLNKQLWTASFALLNAGAGLAAWGLLRAFWPRLEAFPPARLFVFLGQVALTLYVVHMLLIAALIRPVRGADDLWTLGFDALMSTGLPPPWLSLAFALASAALCIALTALLARRGWIIKA